MKKILLYILIIALVLLMIKISEIKHQETIDVLNSINNNSLNTNKAITEFRNELNNITLEVNIK